jgi:hypothetical protein
VYLGLYLTESEAARSYDAALVRLRGLSAATNFSLGKYREQLAEYYEMQGVSTGGGEFFFGGSEGRGCWGQVGLVGVVGGVDYGGGSGDGSAVVGAVGVVGSVNGGSGFVW